MIQVDDSGWGSLLGGVMIGMYNTDNKKFKAKLIPVSYFQGEAFKKKKYLDQAIKIVLMYWPELGDTEYFEICRGYALDGVYEFLATNLGDRKISRVEIKDPLQSMLEERFAKSLERVGVPQRTDGAHCLSFDNQLSWVKENPKRVKYVKTGWKSWKEKYEQEIRSHSRSTRI